MDTNIVNIVRPKNQFAVAAKDRTMPKRRFSNQLIHIMDDIVCSSAEYDKHTRQYHLDYTELTDLQLEELMAQLLIDNEDVASEAVGPDNERFLPKMLPALVKLLQDSTNKDNIIDFIEEWKYGTSRYAQNRITELLDWRVSLYNYDIAMDVRGCV